MPLDEKYPQAVCLLVAPRPRAGLMEVVPVGTAFLVTVPAKVNPKMVFVYLVTAKHVIKDQTDISVRFTTKDGQTMDMPVPDWSEHLDADVATAVVRPDDRISWSWIPENLFADVAEAAPQLGDPVYFIGLLAAVPEMGEKNIPMVRSGTLGAKNQSGIPVRKRDNTREFVTGHLVDCRAYSGFSGSPCFVQFHPETETGISMTRHTVLLGVVTAHFDQRDKAWLEGDQTVAVNVPIHAGVGVVVPVERLRELLNSEELTAMREAEEKKISSHPQDAATHKNPLLNS